MGVRDSAGERDWLKYLALIRLSCCNQRHWCGTGMHYFNWFRSLCMHHLSRSGTFLLSVAALPRLNLRLVWIRMFNWPCFSHFLFLLDEKWTYDGKWNSIVLCLICLLVIKKIIKRLIISGLSKWKKSPWLGIKDLKQNIQLLFDTS